MSMTRACLVRWVTEQTKDLPEVSPLTCSSPQVVLCRFDQINKTKSIKDHLFTPPILMLPSPRDPATEPHGRWHGHFAAETVRTTTTDRGIVSKSRHDPAIW